MANLHACRSAIWQLICRYLNLQLIGPVDDDQTTPWPHAVLMPNTCKKCFEKGGLKVAPQTTQTHKNTSDKNCLDPLFTLYRLNFCGSL